MLKIEQLRKAKTRYSAEYERLPDPGDEGIPNKRLALEAELARLRQTVTALHIAESTLGDITSKRERYATAKEALLAAETALLEQLSDAEAKLETVKVEHGPHNCRQQEREIEAIEGAILAIHNGWSFDGMLRRTSPPEKLVSLMPPGFDWSSVKPLSYLERLIADLDKRRATLERKISPYLKRAA